MTRKKVLTILSIVILLSLFIKPVRHFWTGFFSGLFAEEFILYDGFPVSNDTIYRVIHNGKFESDQYLIELTDSLQIMLDKHTKETSKNKIKWINENEYYLFYSNNKYVLKNKIINLTDTSFTIIYSMGKPAKKIDLKIKTAHNSMYN